MRKRLGDTFHGFRFRQAACSMSAASLLAMYAHGKQLQFVWQRCSLAQQAGVQNLLGPQATGGCAGTSWSIQRLSQCRMRYMSLGRQARKARWRRCWRCRR